MNSVRIEFSHCSWKGMVINVILNFKTPKELNIQIASRVRDIRKRRGITQEKLSQISGVSLGSVKRFERIGEISLLSLSKIAVALEVAEELNTLFVRTPIYSIEEIIHGEDK